jgi:hypothetical protein
MLWLDHTMKKTGRWITRGRGFQAMPGKTPRVVQMSGSDRTTCLAEGVEQQQRRRSRTNVGCGVHKLLSLLKRRHEHVSPLTLDTCRRLRPQDPNSLPRQHMDDHTP